MTFPTSSGEPPHRDDEIGARLAQRLDPVVHVFLDRIGEYAGKGRHPQARCESAPSMGAKSPAFCTP